MDDSHTKTTEEVVNYFKTDEHTGLSDEQIKRAQEKYGPNGELMCHNDQLITFHHTYDRFLLITSQGFQVKHRLFVGAMNQNLPVCHCVTEFDVCILIKI